MKRSVESKIISVLLEQYPGIFAVTIAREVSLSHGQETTGYIFGYVVFLSIAARGQTGLQGQLLLKAPLTTNELLKDGYRFYQIVEYSSKKLVIVTVVLVTSKARFVLILNLLIIALSRDRVEPPASDGAVHECLLRALLDGCTHFYSRT